MPCPSVITFTDGLSMDNLLNQILNITYIHHKTKIHQTFSSLATSLEHTRRVEGESSMLGSGARIVEEGVEEDRIGTSGAGTSKSTTIKALMRSNIGRAGMYIT